ncbi:uncharacterized protein PV06_08335 [Exophiala oligosperma]|uniref:Uncharacterized protein n=1 Tax=Exophiala oligosperma TaxID=215243 RepID=A0A0D2DW44_9EURO|nr:uncharacterized protein PV06_08335 [Exophiala oligosperma]KIW39749.1 hypothetical protein PV06_08335 [Exophiala oligosperma]
MSRPQSEIGDTIEVTRYPSKPTSAPRLANGIGPKPPIPARRQGLSSPPSSPSPNPHSTHPAPQGQSSSLESITPDDPPPSSLPPTAALFYIITSATHDWGLVGDTLRSTDLRDGPYLPPALHRIFDPVKEQEYIYICIF